MSRFSKAVNCCSFIALLSLTAITSTAQVYQTTDENGNPIFSDKPSNDATEVDIQQTNSAKSVDVPPPSPRQQEPSSTAQTSEPQQTEQLDRYIVNNRDDDNGRENLRPQPENPIAKPPVNRPARPAKGR